MSIHKGDTVKVVNPQLKNSGVRDREGKVLSVDHWNESCSVDITWDAPEDSGWTTQGVLGSYLFDELEVVESVHEVQHVRAIANALYTEGGFGETLESLQEIAARLYKAGCRFNG